MFAVVGTDARATWPRYLFIGLRSRIESAPDCLLALAFALGLGKVARGDTLDVLGRLRFRKEFPGLGGILFAGSHNLTSFFACHGRGFSSAPRLHKKLS
jgi:hypothetical protein